ncbi:hypothetical protein PINS_up015266 [Pythium insidiosum]|nr:hypothetical protein PINS_up015266 [Pythium insidiosum]
MAGAQARRVYRPTHRRVDAQQLQQAIEEFERRINDGEEDVEVVLATQIPVAKWTKSSTDRFRSVLIEARWFGRERFADLIITKVRERADECAVFEVSGQLGNYAKTYGDVLAGGGGNMNMQFPNNGARVIRRPDTALQPILSTTGETPPAPRLNVEVEFSNRSISRAQTYTREYFDLIPQLNAALLFKFFGCRADGTYACVAILYRRTGNQVVVADQVSFGSADLADEARKALDDCVPLRALPVVPMPVPFESPWNAGDDPFVRIPGADVFDGALVPPTPEPASPPPGGFPDVVIDLWRIFRGVNFLWF